jgi:hypothetical protein
MINTTLPKRKGRGKEKRKTNTGMNIEVSGMKIGAKRNQVQAPMQNGKKGQVSLHFPFQNLRVCIIQLMLLLPPIINLLKQINNTNFIENNMDELRYISVIRWAYPKEGIQLTHN